MSTKKETGVMRLEGETKEQINVSHGTLSQKTMGPYRIERSIGCGGMGFVYEATDTRLNRRVALKTIESGKGINEAVIMRFRREAQSAARLRHPNIVSVHDVGREAGFDYFTMDLVVGMTFDKWIQSTKSTLRDRVKIMEKVARALHYAHQQGVIHRDVKPGNIMIDDASGEPQIMDFGLARNTKDTSNLTLAGSIVGTPAFMAPEQTMGESSEVGAKADIWALGVVLYETLLGKSPFDNGNVYQTVYAVLHSDPQSPRKVNPEFPRDLETIILKCLEKQVQKRYESAETLADDLNAWLNGRSISTRRASWWEKWMKKLTGKKAISMNEFVLEQQARQRAEAQRLELQTRVESESKQDWRLVFEENFSDPDVASRWEIYGKTWAIKNGEFCIWGGEPQILYLRKEFTGDLRIEFECYQTSDYLSDVSCFMHALPLSNREKACESGYMFQYGASGNIRSFIERSGKRLWEKTHSPIIPNVRYRMVAEKSGNKLSFWINDLLICEVKDDEPLSGAERGSLGIYSWKVDVHYLYIKIYQLGVPVKDDLLEVAHRQLGKGRYESAIDLFKEVMESSTDPVRIQQAREGIQISNEKWALKQDFQNHQKTVFSHWPQAKLDLSDKGLILDVSALKISDLSPIAGLPLNELYAFRNEIENLESLRGMPLSNLQLTFNNVSNIDPLRDLPLRTLNISENLVTSLEPLKGKKFHVLAIGLNPIEDYNVLSEISVDHFSCPYCNLSRLEFLRGMALERLTCSENNISDLSPLQGMSLRSLQCDRNLISDLEPLRGLPLHTLNISRNRIENLEPLRNLKLRDLRCSGNPIKSLEPFYDDPPMFFVFDCDTLPTEELERAAQHWERKKIYKYNVQAARTLKAFRENDVSRLKTFATPFGAYIYLLMQKPTSWFEAKKICEGLGGEMVMFESEREQEFLRSVTPLHTRVWTGEAKKLESGAQLLSRKIALQSDGFLYGQWTGRNIAYGHHSNHLPFIIKWKINS